MLVQALDDKQHCIGIYYDGKLLYDCEEFDFDGVSATWNYNPVFAQNSALIASLFVGGKSLNEVCPDFLRHRWEAISARMRAFYKSFSTAKISLERHCFYDLVPLEFLFQLCAIKDAICEQVFMKYEKPHNYDYLRDLAHVLGDISTRKLNINLSGLTPKELAATRNRKFIKNIQTNRFSKYCDFDIFGTKTGRLTTKRGSFPVLTMHKELRKTIKPTNDFFIEVDYNAAELRVLFALAGKEQPEIDIHEWNAKNVYRGLVTRGSKEKNLRMAI